MTELIATLRELMKKVGVLAEVVDALDPDKLLASQGVDSIDYPLTVIAVQHHFGVELPETELFDIKTLRDFAERVDRKLRVAAKEGD